ncbi:MAG TPA: hypothetical protein VHB77_22530 [Planctomycetaceae bacterium]|nr:hypothetical protein [Planctomycetaceae bacterium]
MDEEYERFTELGCMRGTIIWGTISVIVLTLGLLALRPNSHQPPTLERFSIASPVDEGSHR